MPKGESKLARLLPGIAARGAETQESARKLARKEEDAAALPSAYGAERKKGVAFWSVLCLMLSMLLGSMAFAMSCVPQRVALPTISPTGQDVESHAGSPLRFWQQTQNRFSYLSATDHVLAGALLVNFLAWLAAAVSVWGAGHWLIVRCYSRRWKFSLADMLAMTAAAAFFLGAWRMDHAFRQSEDARRFLQTVSEDANHRPVYAGPLVVPISEVSPPAFLFFCLAGGSVGINLFHIVDRYALQWRPLKGSADFKD
jgi:hypothetical protein